MKKPILAALVAVPLTLLGYCVLIYLHRTYGVEGIALFVSGAAAAVLLITAVAIAALICWLRDAPIPSPPPMDVDAAKKVPPPLPDFDYTD